MLIGPLALSSLPSLPIITRNSFPLQFQNIFLSDTSVGHLMYVFPFPFLNKKPSSWTQPALTSSDES